eukprot:10560746-Alexandrium_andersonii.AAC.1
MSASLVGSEMCIRDSSLGVGSGSSQTPSRLSCTEWISSAITVRCVFPVSYTHLTLPTICSV